MHVAKNAAAHVTGHKSRQGDRQSGAKAKTSRGSSGGGGLPPRVRLWCISLETSAHCLVRTISVGVGVVVRISTTAGLHARVILDGATCQPRELGDVSDALSVLGVWYDR